MFRPNSDQKLNLSPAESLAEFGAENIADSMEMTCKSLNFLLQIID
jgi:hypothetical protein